MANTTQETQTKETQPVPAKPAGTAATPLFVTTCLVVPILWGVLVHQIFKRLRSKSRTENPRETAWEDYQI